MTLPVLDWRARVLDAVDLLRPTLVPLLSELVRTPSMTGTDVEHDLLATLARDLTEEGLEVDHWAIDLDATTGHPDFPGLEAPRTEGYGLVARLPGGDAGPSLMLNAHVDVVPTGDRAAWTDPDPFSGTVRQGRLMGRGACDMKGGLAASLLAVRALRRSGVPLRGDLLMACVQGEEDGGLGTFATLQRGWRADACVVPEPTDLDVVPANAGALTFRLRVTGRATHASRHTEGVSAIARLWPLWQALEDLEQRRNLAVDPLMRRWPLAYPLSIGTLRAGDWPSSVPDLLIAEGRLGVALEESVEDARTAFEEAIAAACAADPWLREHPAHVEWWGGQFGPGRLDPDHPLVAAVGAAHAQVSGRPQQIYGAPYGSDLRLLTAAGVPTVHYGPGDAALAHAPDESVPVEDVLTCARALALLAVEHCGT